RLAQGQRARGTGRVPAADHRARVPRRAAPRLVAPGAGSRSGARQRVPGGRAGRPAGVVRRAPAAAQAAACGGGAAVLVGHVDRGHASGPGLLAGDGQEPGRSRAADPTWSAPRHRPCDLVAGGDTMNETRFHQALRAATEVGRPPLALDAAGMLNRARRARNRRRASLVVGSSALAAAAVTAVALTLPGAAEPGAGPGASPAGGSGSGQPPVP